MSNASFDIVSKVDRQEIDNALNQAVKELSQRFDFKNTGATIEWQGEMGDRDPGQLRGAGRRPRSTCSRTSWSSARCR